jgi:hypothetical protein
MGWRPAGPDAMRTNLWWRIGRHLTARAVPTHPFRARQRQVIDAMTTLTVRGLQVPEG